MEKISADNFSSKYKPKPKDLVLPKQLSIAQVNKVFESVEDLVVEGFRPWFCKAIYKLGPEKVLELHDAAKQSKADDKRKLFTALVRAEMDAK